MISLLMRGAVVTGGNRGIGKAISLAFLRAGWPVTAVVRTEESAVPLRR
jgi:NAD(P)-dependent dehydrogenase (short-subunit alcohol dehydrogenase family)